MKLIFFLNFRQLVYLKLKNEQFLSVPFFILCDGLKNDTILLGGDVCNGWHSRYWGEYKGRKDVEHNELSVQCLIDTHKKFPQVSSMMVNTFYKIQPIEVLHYCYNIYTNYLC